MGKNDVAWEKIFDKYSVIDQIREKNVFEISANQIKEFREPRLMAKFDYYNSLPQVFKKNKLGILPTRRGKYIIGEFNLFEEIPSVWDDSPIVVTYNDEIESVSKDNIFSESISLLIAYNNGILHDFLSISKDDFLLSTINGRMGTGAFGFNVETQKDQSQIWIDVENSQCEIDGGYESRDSLFLFEIKNFKPDDFLIRQVYYPYRLWKNKVKKQVVPIFMYFSNDEFHFSEYKFLDDSNYNSLSLVRHKSYTFGETEEFSIKAILDSFNKIPVVDEPGIPFPQADRIDRVIDLISIISEKIEVSKEEVTLQYGFDPRQTDYYTNAALYLGYLEKAERRKFVLSGKGETYVKLDKNGRRKDMVNSILEHSVFRKCFASLVRRRGVITKGEIIEIMRGENLYKIDSEVTRKRRASTISHWIAWIYSKTENQNG